MNKHFKHLFVLMFLILTMSFVSAALTDGLKGYWNFDEATGSTLTDSLGFYNGTTTGATVNQTGKINKSYYFDGVNDFITHESDALGSLYSISLWIKIDTNTASYVVLSGQGSSNPNAWQPGLTFYNVDNSLRYAGNYNDSSISTGVSSILDATWYHIVITANNKTAKIYLNGNLTEEQTSLNTKAWTQLRYIARKDTGDYFKGYIDEMGIWNKELTTDEISELYNSGNGFSYPFTDLTSPTASVGTGTYNNNFTVTLDNNNEADIYYTTDGSDPDDTDTLYSGAISITGTTTLKAISWVSDENKSEISSYTYTMVVAGTPTADKDSGLYYDPFNVTLTKTGTTTGTTLTYTLTGADPTIASTEYTTPIEISADTTLKFAEFKTGYTATSIVTKTYEVREPITNFYFYDENTLGAIATVTITDSNGTIYTSDGDGLWTTSLSNIAKSFTISKTGYDTRDLDFYFKRQDANFNFMLSQDGNSTAIEFLVKDENGIAWASKYLMFVTDGNIISSLLTDSSGYATANILPTGDYNAILYTADGNLVYTYQKTTVTVNKPKDEITLVDISPYDVEVGGLLSYDLENQTDASIAFNVFAGTVNYYDITVVDYNATPADRLYIPRRYQVIVPMGTDYVQAYTVQPYLLAILDGVSPSVYTVDTFSRALSDIRVDVLKYMGGSLVLVESLFSDSVGKVNFSGYPLQTYYFKTYYNNTLMTTTSYVPTASTVPHYIIIDTIGQNAYVPSGNIMVDFSDTAESVGYNENLTANITVYSTLYANIVDVTIAWYDGATLLDSEVYNTPFTTNHVDITKLLTNPLSISKDTATTKIKVTVRYLDNGTTYSAYFYKIININSDPTIPTVFESMKTIGASSRLLTLFLSILITIALLFVIIRSGVVSSPNVITIIGLLILGFFVYVGWISTGVKIFGTDPLVFIYSIGVIIAIYFLSINQGN